MSSLLTYVEAEEDRFFEEYNRLASVLAQFWDLEGQTDASFTEDYVAHREIDLLEELLADGQRFLAQHELPMRLIATNANRYLITETEQRQWLQTLLDCVKTELSRRQEAPDAERGPPLS